jgi:hypothetical protein
MPYTPVQPTENWWMTRYRKWRDIPCNPYKTQFEDQNWVYISGKWTAESKCKVYRIFIDHHKIRVVKRLRRNPVD